MFIAQGNAIVLEYTRLSAYWIGFVYIAQGDAIELEYTRLSAYWIGFVYIAQGVAIELEYTRLSAYLYIFRNLLTKTNTPHLIISVQGNFQEIYTHFHQKRAFFNKKLAYFIKLYLFCFLASKVFCSKI